MKCHECKYQKRCDVGTNEAVTDVLEKNRNLLYHISTADQPRFEDEENVEKNFRRSLDHFFNIMSVLYTIPMREYFPADDEPEEEKNKFLLFCAYCDHGYKRSIQQAQMRILSHGRASCGFVGEFSSGKTSYLNAEVFGGDILPVGIGATTSIPTYIFPGRGEKLVLENMRGNIRVFSDFKALKQLSHSAKPKECPCRFQWDAVIKRLFCFSSKLKHNRDLVYVDLPGYSASADDNRSMQEALEGCDKIVYFKPIQSGQLNETDIKYLKALEGKDVMVVLSQADRKSPSDCMNILKLIKHTLEEQEIETNGIVVYTNRPEVFASDTDFCKKLNKHRNKLKEFILDTSAKEQDMALTIDMMQHYTNEFVEHESAIFSALDSIGEAFDDFLGNRKLDGSFFKTWKHINKDIADSSGNYVEEHIFTNNTVRIREYLDANISRINNYFCSDTYDSNFNSSYQHALRGYAFFALYKTALYTQITGSADSNYEQACEIIDGMKENYQVVKENVDYLFNSTREFFGYHKNLSGSIAQDAQLAFSNVEKAYKELLDYVKNYEERWKKQ